MREFLRAVDPWWYFAFFTVAGRLHAQAMLEGIWRCTPFSLEPVFAFDRCRYAPKQVPDSGVVTGLKDLKKVKRRCINVSS